jgi:hypothetical protein
MKPIGLSPNCGIERLKELIHVLNIASQFGLTL